MRNIPKIDQQTSISATLKAIVGITFLAIVIGCASPPSLSPQATIGKPLYLQNCASCHGPNGEGQWRSQGVLGAPAHNTDGHTWDHPDSQLLLFIRNGLQAAGKYAMPPFSQKLKDAEILAILAYIKGWWTPEQLNKQATLTARFMTPTP
jgi:mono/diheme cytochrome c family protein